MNNSCTNEQEIHKKKILKKNQKKKKETKIIYI